MLDLLFPPLCASCQVRLEHPTHLCDECLAKLKRIEPPWCSRCGIPLSVGRESQLACLACYRNPTPLDLLRSVFVYQEPLRNLIHRWKFNDQPQISDFFAGEMALFVRTYFLDRAWNAIIPVPLHETRHRERDYNQALLLAKILSNRLKVPLEIHTLTRSRPTVAQFSLPRSERKQNLRGAFRVNVPTLLEKRVLLVDDLYTTGATLHQCAVVLKKEGASLVDAVTLARTFL